MNRWVIGIFMLALVAPPSSAQDAVTGAQLTVWCNAWVRVFIDDRARDPQDIADGASCSAFIAGVLEGASALTSQLYSIDTRRAQPPAIGLCHSRDDGYAPLIEAVRRYLTDEPGSIQMDAATIVVRAIQTSFPCEGA